MVSPLPSVGGMEPLPVKCADLKQVRWMYWLETKLLKEKRQLGEWVAVQTLTRFRRQEDMFA